MENNNSMKNGIQESDDFKRFARKRMAAGVLIAIVGLWAFGLIIGFFDQDTSQYMAENTGVIPSHESTEVKPLPDAHQTNTKRDLTTEVKKPTTVHQSPADDQKTESHEKIAPATLKAAESAHKAPSHVAEVSAKGHEPSTSPLARYPIKGMAFVKAAIAPLSFELEERFWGWRTNDIINITDNVNNFQLGVLEVTRRTTVVLAQVISRTGVTASFDEDLINAMDWFMVKYDRYWFPSPESKYREGLDSLQKYFEKIGKGEAKFYTRNENLIPLLKEYENLLGSCDDDLVKTYEENGEKISWFKTDDYFFYAQGVASAIFRVLEAVAVDFGAAIRARGAEEDLHHAILSCRHAVEIKPIIITDSSYSGILANHRANMAAHISHARFYIGVVIKTLST